MFYKNRLKSDVESKSFYRVFAQLRNRLQTFLPTNASRNIMKYLRTSLKLPQDLFFISDEIKKIVARSNLNIFSKAEDNT